MTTTTPAGLASMRRAASKIGMPLAEYLRRREAGLRHCPICLRWLTEDDYGTVSRCRECHSTRKRKRVRPYAPRRRGGKAPAPGEGDHLVYLDPREGIDVLVLRCRTRAEAEREVRERNRQALAAMPGELVAAVPLYYCVSETEDREEIP